jgi:hypothetical protein
MANGWDTVKFDKDGTIKLEERGTATVEELRRLDADDVEFYVDRLVDIKRARELGVLDLIRCATCIRRLSAYGDEPVCLCETSSDDETPEDRNLTELAHIQHG